MPFSKRLLDLAVALLLLLLLLPVFGAIALVILVRDGRPILYVSERMRTPSQPFDLIKFRTMKTRSEDRGVSGGDKTARVTASGAFLRRHRLDELPQLWNVLRGDISLVGPRPPLREYVERFPVIYGRVLRSRPGITGLASIYAHRHEEWLLARTRDAAETDHVYTRRCIPLKARLDLMYQRNWSLCFDLRLLLATIFPAAR